MVKCTELLEALYDAIKEGEDAKAKLVSQIQKLYTKEELAMLGGRPATWEFIRLIERDVAGKEIRIENTKLCRKLMCIEASNLLKALDDYYTAGGKKRKIWRKLDECEL